FDSRGLTDDRCERSGRLRGLDFFFSSRRRHTRWPRDWSSDVCSSDLQQFKERNEQAFGALQRHGEEKGITLMRTPMGLALAPRRDGKVLTPELFEALPEAERERIQRDLEEVQSELEAVMQKVPQWEREHREAVRELNCNTTGAAIALMMDELRA